MKTLLKNRKLYKVSGKDANNFLQSQFTNDINIINSKKYIQINAYCQHQGRILALIWVFKHENELYISFLDELAELIVSKFDLYKMMSEVVLEDFTEKLYIYGFIDEKCPECYKIINNLSIFLSKEKLQVSEYFNWEVNSISNMLPEIYPGTSEKFTPQALNLDIDELGVSFSKGCYPGQEVVARMHYLGKPKRRLFHFESMCEPTIGDSITVKESESLKSSGEVIRVAKIHSSYHLLGTLEVKHSANQIYLNNDIKKPLKIIDA